MHRVEGSLAANHPLALVQMAVDMLNAGIVDPAKVMRVALQDAASIAGLMITTEAMVAETQKKAEEERGSCNAAWRNGRHGLLISQDVEPGGRVLPRKTTALRLDDTKQPSLWQPIFRSSVEGCPILTDAEWSRFLTWEVTQKAPGGFVLSASPIRNETLLRR